MTGKLCEHMGTRQTESGYKEASRYLDKGELLSRMAREEATGKKDLKETLDASESTVHRKLNTLIEDGVVERKSHGEYSLTATGEEVTRELERFRDGVSNIKELSTVIESADTHGVEFDPEPFKNGVVAPLTPKNPYEPGRRCLEVFRETDELRLLVVSTATPRFWKEKQRLVSEGRETEIVCPEGVVEASLDTVSRDIVGGLVRNMDIRVHDDVPFSIALFDERVGVGGHGDDGKLEVFADTDDEDAYEWGEGIYERYRRESDPMFERFDAEEVFDRLGFEGRQVANEVYADS